MMAEQDDDLKPIQIDALATDEDVAELDADIEQALRKAEEAKTVEDKVHQQ